MRHPSAIASLLLAVSACSAAAGERSHETTPAPGVSGEAIFLARCATCHGSSGRGDGRMRRIVTAPPPADLTRSRLGRDALRRIISRGGAAVGRSGQMPPWGSELGAGYVERLVDYVLTLRNEAGAGD